MRKPFPLEAEPREPIPQGRRAADPRAARALSATLQAVPRRVGGMGAFYPDTSTSTRHAHARGQFILGVTGVTAMLTDEGCFVVPPDHGLWIPPGVVHQSRSWADVEVQTIYVEAEAMPDGHGACRLLRTTPLLRALVAEVLAMPVLYDEHGREGRLVDLLLAEIGRMPASSLHVVVPQDDRLGRICESVLSRAGETRTLDEWALLTGLSRRTITRLFRRETGMSFSAWQQRVRLMEALARLGGGASVTSVALDVGYDSPSAFTAMFKRVLGTCPRAYLDWA